MMWFEWALVIVAAWVAFFAGFGIGVVRTQRKWMENELERERMLRAAWRAEKRWVGPT